VEQEKGEASEGEVKDRGKKRAKPDRERKEGGKERKRKKERKAK
jgi:hypothetical protein